MHYAQCTLGFAFNFARTRVLPGAKILRLGFLKEIVFMSIVSDN